MELRLVEITPSGRRALERADKARESLEDEVLRGLSAEDRNALPRPLEAMFETLYAEVRD